MANDIREEVKAAVVQYHKELLIERCRAAGYKKLIFGVFFTPQEKLGSSVLAFPPIEFKVSRGHFSRAALWEILEEPPFSMSCGHGKNRYKGEPCDQAQWSIIKDVNDMGKYGGRWCTERIHVHFEPETVML